ncbi:hypothetical protein EDB92DRAFT_1843632 [Lactarius akahatsu]|uniref:Uncharacterized protein n=1 Tax=Lactarius akahatsu TaxID=416441 RepID=A0AAD4LRG4_9AGAM|nr:hypothetical protein EDB92DRAFT_1843632 [Lactarius akahatsu]
MSSTPNKANLFPVLPSTIRDSRYRGCVRVRVSPTMVPLGSSLVSAPSYQTQGWTVSAHPEGKRYAHVETHSGITLVTEAHIAEPGVPDQLYAWLAVICNVIAEEHVPLPAASHLYLEIHQDSGTCDYYFAQHDLRTIFWLHALDTISVGLPHSFSSGHLQYALQENYWIHVELFPETASPYSLTALNELQIIFLHARADALTSETPTFPYTAKQSEEFIDLLQRSKDHASSPYVTTYVARLWATVANHRFFTHFGEEHCRLSSDQSILEVPDNKRCLVLAFISNALLFGLPNEHQARFESLWVDQLAYTAPWRKHVSGTIDELNQMTSWLLALTISNTFMIQVSSIPALTHSSLLLCAFGLIMTSVLLREQRGLVDTNAATAAVYLDDRNTTSCGFQPIAIVHSLPKALFVWAMLLFAIQGFWMTFSGLPPHLLVSTLFPIGAVLVVVCACIWKALHPRQKPFEGSMLSVSVPPMIPAEDQKEHTTADLMV